MRKLALPLFAMLLSASFAAAQNCVGNVDQASQLPCTNYTTGFVRATSTILPYDLPATSQDGNDLTGQGYVIDLNTPTYHQVVITLPSDPTGIQAGGITATGGTAQVESINGYGGGQFTETFYVTSGPLSYCVVDTYCFTYDWEGPLTVTYTFAKSVACGRGGHTCKVYNASSGSGELSVVVLSAP